MKKLGRCTRCIQSSALLAIASWAFVFTLWLALAPTWMLWVAIGGAAAFTLLTLAHLGAIIARALAVQHSLVKGSRMRRSQALVAFAKVTLGAAIFGLGIVVNACSTRGSSGTLPPSTDNGRSPVLSGPTSVPSATPTPDPTGCCEGLHNVTLPVGPVTVCAANKADAAAAAKPLLDADPAGIAGATARCAEFPPTSTCKKCKLVARVITAPDCVTEGKKCSPPVSGKKQWLCEEVIIQVKCTCA